MKKLLVILLAIIAVFTLVACGQKVDPVIGGMEVPNPWTTLNSYEEAKAKNALAPDLSEYGCVVKSYSYEEEDDILDIDFEALVGEGLDSSTFYPQSYSLRIVKDDEVSSVRELSGCHYEFVDVNGIYFMMDHVFQRMDAKNGDKNFYLYWFEEDGYYFFLTSEFEGEFVNPFKLSNEN